MTKKIEPPATVAECDDVINDRWSRGMAIFHPECGPAPARAMYNRR